MRKDINRMPITYAIHVTTQRYIILMGVGLLHLSSTLYYSIADGIPLGNLLLPYYWIGNTILYL